MFIYILISTVDVSLLSLRTRLSTRFLLTLGSLLAKFCKERSSAKMSVCQVPCNEQEFWNLGIHCQNPHTSTNLKDVRELYSLELIAREILI